jgi:hypothetical protein
MLAIAIIAVSIEWSCVVVLVHPVPPHGVEVGDGVDVRPRRVEVFGVDRVVDGVGLGLPDDGAVEDLGRVDEAQRREFLLGQLDEVLILAGPQAVALEAEVLETKARGPGARDHRLAPVVEVLDATDLHPGVWM